MESIGTDAPLNGLVGASEPYPVRRDDPRTGPCKDRNHLAVKVAATRLAMNAQKCMTGVLWSLIYIVDAQALIAWQRVQIMRLESPIGKIGEAIVRCAFSLDLRISFLMSAVGLGSLLQ